MLLGTTLFDARNEQCTITLLGEIRLHNTVRIFATAGG